MNESPEPRPAVAGAEARRLRRLPYKWIVLTNTTLGIFMAMLDGSIVEISLPAIFHGIGVNPLAPEKQTTCSGL